MIETIMRTIELDIEAGKKYCEQCEYKKEKGTNLFICQIFQEGLPLIDGEPDTKRVKQCLMRDIT